MANKPDVTLLTIRVGLLAWLVPGLGHFHLGLRGLAYVYFGAISFAYLSGMLISGVKTSVDPVGNVWLFLAEMGVGGYTLLFYAIARSLPTVEWWQPSPYVAYYPEADLAQIYLAVAGLLNVLAMLDALARAQTGGLPVFHFENVIKERARVRADERAKAAAAPQTAPGATTAATGDVP